MHAFIVGFLSILSWRIILMGWPIMLPLLPIKLLQVTMCVMIDPFCKFGELVVPTRIYHNIRKLMEYFGIKVDKIGGTGRELWDYTG